LNPSALGHLVFIGQVVGGGQLMTLAMAVSIAWGVFLLELVLLGWWIARHHR